MKLSSGGVAALFSSVVAILLFAGGVSKARAEMVVSPTTIYIGAPYRSIPMKQSQQGACKRACQKDKRCRSWTFIRIGTLGNVQCRLFNEIGRSVKNGCCTSGYKKAKEIVKTNGKLGRQVKRCRAWAADAIKLNEQNVGNDCGYRGRAWHANDKRHFRRCMQLGPKALRAERRGQRAAINSCISELGFEKRAYCSYFSKVAVVQSETRRKADCKAGDNGLWSTNQKADYQWCLRADRDESEARQDKRQKALNRCFRQKGKQQARTGPCHKYAEAAISDFRNNIRKGCDLHGLTWHNNYKRHVNWCRMNSDKARRREAKKRSLVLKTCKLFGKFKIDWR
jgi:hypothetical protein